MVDERIADQIRYYRRRAPEYDVTAYGDLDQVQPTISAAVDTLRPAERTLELACGTGVWTQHLTSRVESLVAVDAAPEALALARRRAPSAMFVIADIFELVLRARFDTVFFAAWLSHVPMDRFAEFWSRVDSLVQGAGKVLFVDEALGERDKESFVAGERDIAERVMGDGSVHRLVKVYWSPGALQNELVTLGWDASVRQFDDRWLVGEARPRR
ncbi:MAG: class I SAM-dependent methyltransferase [Actinomycetes bacterium]